VPRALARAVPTALEPAQDFAKVGAGSYATRLPAGAKGPPAQILRTAKVKGPMPTNDWWSALAWKPFGEAMFPHPLAIRAMPAGLRVAYPRITVNNAAIFGSMPPIPTTLSSVIPPWKSSPTRAWKTHIAWNPDAQARTVTFSDGVAVPCGPRSYGMR